MNTTTSLDIPQNIMSTSRLCARRATIAGKKYEAWSPVKEKKILLPLSWRSPRFVELRCDLFHPNVKDEWIDRIFAVMALCPRHTFQVLTKRPKRMHEYLTAAAGRLADCIESMRFDEPRHAVGPLPHLMAGEKWFPLANVWLGVSCEDQETAEERVPLLLQTPAAVRFISAEPLLGELLLDEDWLFPVCRSCGTYYRQSWTECPSSECDGLHPWETHVLDWVICGGESGPGARPFDTQWAQSLVEQCHAAGVACFVKQLGGHVIQGGERRVKKDKKGGDMHEWPHELKVRQFPEYAHA